MSERTDLLQLKDKILDSAIPQHIAVIMDGNGRWAKSKNKIRTFGHVAGVKSLKKTIKACLDVNVTYLSVYAFSLENWKRPLEETSFLMKLLIKILKEEAKNLCSQEVRVRIIGNKKSLDKDVIKEIEKIESSTKTFNKLNLNIMLNYGSRQEILHCLKKIASSHTSLQELTEADITNNLFTSELPDPDILIRSGGEKRISNFMLWQLSYAELFFIDKLWPDVSEIDILNIILDYQNRNRRFGGL
tara:strand:+ start:105 stop:839 length:735 start_codon:yes stop_codon:yes gene_type:complete